MAAPGFATAPATLANLAHLTPRPVKGLFGDNYLALADMTWTQQFLPEVYEKEIERYGNRTITGFLRMVGAEMPMASDQVVWSEQGRLHIAYDTFTSNGGAAAPIGAGAQTIGLPSPGADGKIPLLGPGMTLVIALGNVTNKVFIKSLGGLAGGVQTYNVEVYDNANRNLTLALQGAVAGAGTALSGFVFGSEYGKGSVLAGNSVDASRIRFEDYLEMSMVEAENSQAAAGAMTDAAGANIVGMQGLFASLEDRGLVFNDPNFDSIVAGATGIDQFDTILQELDKQGAIEENMMFLDRSTSLSIDNMLAVQNSYGAGGTSYGVFDNSEDMALNLGFSGFRRGAYDFYKTDWKYLNDSTTRGLIDDIKGVIVPAGTSTVYDQQLGQNISRPFLHIRYRASEADDRRLKSWVTGSVGGNYTSDADVMNVHFLSERTLCTQAANNFVLLKAT